MKVETKVGLLFIAGLACVISFAYLLGLLNPFSNSHTLNILYNYAGGIEEGSPVRVMGIVVGKVRKIEFDPSQKSASGEEVKLRIKISVDKKAWESIRKNSHFYINMAGVIGEKFLEISPGTMEANAFVDGETVRGEDPPRIDQLISQGYGLAGKVIDLVENNKGSITSLIAQLDKLTINFNKSLTMLDKIAQNPQGAHLINNAIKLTDNMVDLTGKLNSKKSEEMVELVQKLLLRLEEVDGPTVRKFFQQEGIKAKMF
jgi:phospholipid/cholesterol/gamma-HCH transport system substrate-binding protein